MAIFFTSDTHFGHENIISFSKRPFETVRDMDEALIENWNAAICPADTVYHLGDFAYRNEKSVEKYLSRLNGEIHLIIGNHDDDGLRESGQFASVSDIKVITIDKKSVVLCHYPMREWPLAWRGSWHLFGHVHGHLDVRPYGFSLDVGVDSHGYAPIGVERIREIMAERETPFSEATKHNRF